jgi:hypothetical protein
MIAKAVQRKRARPVFHCRAPPAQFHTAPDRRHQEIAERAGNATVFIKVISSQQVVAQATPVPTSIACTRADTVWTAHSIHLLTLEHEMISALTLFVKPESPRLFTAFGLPLVIPANASSLPT